MSLKSKAVLGTRLAANAWVGIKGRTLFLVFFLAQRFLKKLRRILETALVIGVRVHERLVCFEAGPVQFHARWRAFVYAVKCIELRRILQNREQVQYT